MNSVLPPVPGPTRASITEKAGWIAISCGLMVGFIATMFMLLAALMKSAPQDAEFFPGFAVGQVGPIAMVQAVVAVVAIIAGIGMLKKKAWARTVLEGLCWTTSLEVVALVFGWQKWGIFVITNAPNGGGPDFITPWIVSALSGLSYLLGALMAIRALLSPAMYEALEDGGG